MAFVVGSSRAGQPRTNALIDSKSEGTVSCTRIPISTANRVGRRQRKLARLKDGYDIRSAEAEIHTFAQRLVAEHPDPSARCT
ncbi:MAG: hypothetical protein DMF84_14055 [Acidobacteria bacterium]|nr:MAG: hypothetical protein DMF84_14055 [Acidobacteriota bacterium]